MNHEHRYDRIVSWLSEPLSPTAPIRLEVACECGEVSARWASQQEVEERVNPAYCLTCEDFFVESPHKDNQDCTRHLKRRVDRLEEQLERMKQALHIAGLRYVERS